MAIEVCYRKPHIHDKDLFTEEEELLLEIIAEHISYFIKQIQSMRDLQKSKYQLSITLRSIGDGVIVAYIGGLKIKNMLTFRI